MAPRRRSSIASRRVARQRSSSPSERSEEASATCTSTGARPPPAGVARPSRTTAPPRPVLAQRRSFRLRGAPRWPPRRPVPRTARVVGLLGRCRAASDERCGRPGVGAEPPAGRCCLVHRAPHERVTEDESPRHRTSGARDRPRAGHRVPSRPSVRGSSAIAAARSGSNGSPATAAARSSSVPLPGVMRAPPRATPRPRWARGTRSRCSSRPRRDGQRISRPPGRG